MARGSRKPSTSAPGPIAPSVKARPDSIAAAKAGGLRALMSHPDRTGRYAWAVLSETLAYAAELVPAISDTIQGVDEAMRLGYNWQFGPFELIDQLGTDWFADRLAAEGRPVPELLRLARGGPFYRVQDGRLEQLGVDGSLPAGATARRHPDAGRCEAGRGSLAAQWLRGALGHWRRCRLLRVHRRR